MLSQNIRYGLRTCMRSPGFAAVTALSLALGLGANTAIFSILDAVLFRELPVPQPRQLVQLSGIYRNGGRVPFSFPMFQALERWQQAFSGLYGWTGAALFNVEAEGTLFLSHVPRCKKRWAFYCQSCAPWKMREISTACSVT